TISLYQKEAVFFYFCNLHIQSAIFTVTSMLYAGFRSAKVELLSHSLTANMQSSRRALLFFYIHSLIPKYIPSSIRCRNAVSLLTSETSPRSS
ncbi:hypothetical protein, partial [Paenibacillus sp.]|uniref:hypothetical protein n=1 Tax=Paenibacillus sp. TaxID=58172 RepID=UPI003566E481